MRKCEKCGTTMPADIPRHRVAGLFVCGSCKEPDGLTTKIAHDMSSRDPLVVRHCPFCGSGQVIARNDGSVECDFCQSVFTVRVEPFYPGWPQTVDGTPQDIPLHPNEAGDNAGGFDTEEGGDFPETMNSDEEFEEEGEEEDDGFAGLDTDDQDDEGDDDFDFGKKSQLVTAYGGEVDEETYIKHLAIRIASDEDRERIINMIRMVQ